MSIPLLQTIVYQIRHEANGILSIELRPASDDVSFPVFEAGAHIDLHLGNGLTRSYSLLNPVTDRQRYVVAVLNDRNSRGGSRYVHEQLRVGSTLSISAPRNNFRLEEAAERSVLVAGGIGVTPMLCMLRRLVQLGRPVDFIYCARSRQEAAFIDEVDRLAKQGGAQLRYHFDVEQGKAPNLDRLLGGYAEGTHFYCCGPAPMLDSFEKACAEEGYEHVHVERFSAVPAEGGRQEGYVVELRRTGKVVEVAAGVSLLDALLTAGLRPEYSCKEGVCGACETRVLSGDVEHRDSILTKQERTANRSMMICVSGCRKGPLVLDL